MLFLAYFFSFEDSACCSFSLAASRTHWPCPLEMEVLLLNSISVGQETCCNPIAVKVVLPLDIPGGL